LTFDFYWRDRPEKWKLARSHLAFALTHFHQPNFVGSFIVVTTLQLPKKPSEDPAEDQQESAMEIEPIPDAVLPPVNSQPALISSISSSFQTKLEFSTSPQTESSDLIEVNQDSVWQPAVVIKHPNNHPDPKQRFSGWKVRLLQHGAVRYIWKESEMRPHKVVEFE